MAAYARGDQSAFSELFQSLAPPVHRFLLRRTGNAAVADDMLQTTFMKLHRARGDYKIGSAVRPWVFTIAARVRLDEVRRRRRQPETGDPDHIERASDLQALDRPGAEDQLERADVAAKVRDALEELPETQRLVVLLHRYEGLTFEEIGKALGTTEGAVKLRAFRAYERLRKLLGDIVANQAGEGTRT